MKISPLSIIILVLVGSVSLLDGFSILRNAKSAIHETEAFVLFLIAAVLFSGACVVGAIVELGNKCASLTGKNNGNV